MTRNPNRFTGLRGLILAAVAGGLLAACSVSQEDEAAQIERDILATPGAEDLWRTIKAEYPQDFAALIAELQDLDFAERRDEARVEQLGAEWLQDFFARITPLAVQAPAPELLAWSAAEDELYRTLQRGAVEECAGMTMGEWIVVGDENAAATAAISRRNAAMVRASAAGKRDPQDYAEPDEEAFARYGDAIASTGIAPELQGALGSQEAMQALAPAQQCEIGVAVYAGLTALPDDAEPAMAAYMLAPE